jgi:hypothetical protein
VEKQAAGRTLGPQMTHEPTTLGLSCLSHNMVGPVTLDSPRTTNNGANTSL